MPEWVHARQRSTLGTGSRHSIEVARRSGGGARSQGRGMPNEVRHRSALRPATRRVGRRAWASRSAARRSRRKGFPGDRLESGSACLGGTAGLRFLFDLEDVQRLLLERAREGARRRRPRSPVRPPETTWGGRRLACSRPNRPPRIARRTAGRLGRQQPSYPLTPPEGRVGGGRAAGSLCPSPLSWPLRGR